MDAQLVGRLGVARVTLVGGPHDGERRIAVVGAPIVVPFPPKQEAPEARTGGGIFSFVYGPTIIEGDEWKDAQAKAEQGKAAARFAVYAPVMRDGKATDLLGYVGETEWTPLP